MAIYFDLVWHSSSMAVAVVTEPGHILAIKLELAVIPPLACHDFAGVGAGVNSRRSIKDRDPGTSRPIAAHHGI